MNGTTFTFTLPPGAERPFGYGGRDLLAAALDGLPDVAPLFNYTIAEDLYPSHPRSGIPMARIRSAAHKLTITTMDDDTTGIVLKHLAHICNEIATRCGKHPVVSFRHFDIGVTDAYYPMLYKAHQVVLARGLDACRRFEQMNDAERASLAHAVLCRGLLRQAAQFDVDMPELPLPVIEFGNIVPRAPLITRDGKTLEHGVIASFNFSWDARIEGSWAVGGLTARGYGRVWYADRTGGKEARDVE